MAVGTVKIIDTVKVNGRDVGKLYNAPNGTFLRGLDFNTDQEYFGTKDVDGRRWYDLGGDQWISDEFASHAIKEVGVATGTCRVANFSSDFKAIVRNVPNGIPNGQKLDPNTEWAYNEYAIDQWDYKWFNLGHSQWVTTQEVVDITNSGGNWVFPFGRYAGMAEPAQKFGITSYDRSRDKHLGWFYHDGFDFGSVLYGAGSSFNAVHNGTIIFAGNRDDQGLGMVILEDIGDALVIYQEFSNSFNDILVSAGQKVAAGQTIGRLNSTHLHLGISKNKNFDTALGYSFNQYSENWYNPIATIQNNNLTFQLES